LPSRCRLLPGRVAIRPAVVKLVGNLVPMVGGAVAPAAPSSRMASRFGAVALALQYARLNTESSLCSVRCDARCAGCDHLCARYDWFCERCDHRDHAVASTSARVRSHRSSCRIVTPRGRTRCAGRPIISSRRTIAQSSCVIISSCVRVPCSVGAMR
jgi:hypothetical protein